MKSKKVTLGFVVVLSKTGEHVSEIFDRWRPALEITAKRNAEITAYGIGPHHARPWVAAHKIETHIPAEWKRGVDFEIDGGKLYRLTLGGRVEVS